MEQTRIFDTEAQAMDAAEPSERGVTVMIDGRIIPLTREQEALIRAWASGPI